MGAWRHSLSARKRIAASKIGSKNHQWTENPSYSAAHKWLARNFKKDKKCNHCPSKRFLEWALKKGKKHSHNRKNYLTLCSSCHKKYDYTPERRERLRKSLIGRKILWGKKISKALKGRKLSEEQKRKLSRYAKSNPRPRNEKGQFYAPSTRVSLAGVK